MTPCKAMRPVIIQNVIQLQKERIPAKIRKSIKFCENTVSKALKSQSINKNIIIIHCNFFQRH